jgi:hypothetical protein
MRGIDSRISRPAPVKLRRHAETLNDAKVNFCVKLQWLRCQGWTCIDTGGLAGGGRGGIRTHGTLAGTPVFKTGALNHSATLPNQ